MLFSGYLHSTGFNSSNSSQKFPIVPICLGTIGVVLGNLVPNSNSSRLFSLRELLKRELLKRAGRRRQFDAENRQKFPPAKLVGYSA